ncbi:hypothetical protein I3842_07G096600 [Carya illinoinensis]|uniref:Uncharacterized protein n=1 Tax=Carya illinoinensis TaxID=32201 RepID=A0A922EL73_CARIL|nr:hypothetical protein I3842_07G096600 [Carya illinoinensis]
MVTNLSVFVWVLSYGYEFIWHAVSINHGLTHYGFFGFSHGGFSPDPLPHHCLDCWFTHRVWFSPNPGPHHGFSPMIESDDTPSPIDEEYSWCFNFIITQFSA